MSDTLRHRIGKLMPMLSSDKDGEVVNSVRKILAALKAEGMDVHDLTAAVMAEPTVVYKTTFRDPPKQEPPKGQPNDWLRKAEFCVQHSASLSEREAQFVEDMVGKIQRWGDPTEKQAAWLDAIHSRLRRRYGETA